MTLRLYECAAELIPLLESGIDEDTGEMSPELVNALARFDGAGKSVCAYVLNIEAEAAACKHAIARITARQKALENRAKRLRNYLCHHMAVANITRIDAVDGSFSARLERDRDESVEIEPGATFPPELCLKPPPPEPSKALIKAAIKRGEPIAGAKLIRRDRLVLG